MAFQDQVEDLTSLSVSDTGELSQFLKDGVIDVTNRWLLVKPQDISAFSRESSETTSNASLDLNGAQIISVIRENGTNNQWRNCRQIFPAEQYDVTDTESLSYASKYNPAFMIGDNGQISVFPTPGATTDAFKAYYVNNAPVDKSGAALIHSHSDIGYFADDKVYLVVMYAGIKLLQATMGSNVISITSVPPDAPSNPSISSPGIASITVGSLGTAPTLTATTITTRVSFDTFYEDTSSSNPFGTSSDPGSTVVTAVPPDSIVDTITDFSLSSDFTDAMANAETFFDDEDPEMVASAIQRAQTALQQSLNTFNTDMQKFQASGTGKFGADVAAYQAEVGAQVQEYTQKLQRYSTELSNVFQAWQKTESDSLQQYQLDIQANLNEFNEDNAIYQSTVQEAMKNADIAAAEAQKEGDLTLQATIQDYALELQRYQAETVQYQTEINAEIQEQSVKMQQYQLLYTQLKAEYDTAFMIAAPKQQPQQQVRA